MPTKNVLNIRKVQGKESIRVHCTSGVNIVDRFGDLLGYVAVWYKPTRIANILLMSRAMNKNSGFFYSEGGNFPRMVLPDREVRFEIIPNRTYYFDAAYRENSVLLINTVLKNQKVFKRRDSEGSQEARQGMHLLGFPSDRYFKNMVCLNMIVNFSVNFNNVKHAKLVFGPDITSLKVKLVRRKMASVVTDYVEITRES